MVCPFHKMILLFFFCYYDDYYYYYYYYYYYPYYYCCCYCYDYFYIHQTKLAHPSRLCARAGSPPTEHTNRQTKIDIHKH